MSIYDKLKQVNIKQVRVGREYYIETGVRPVTEVEITYLGNGIGAYKDSFQNEFTFANNTVSFYVLENTNIESPMTEEEYTDAEAFIKSNMESKLSVLRSQYMRENAMFKVGDILESASSEFLIKVDKILYRPPSHRSNVPSIVYSGVQLTQKKLPRKDGARLHMEENKVLKVG